MKLVRAKEGYRKVGDKYLLAKKCTKCGRWLVASEVNFYKNKGCKNGLEGQCKECRSEKRNKYYEANKEKIREKNKQYNQNNKEKMAEYHKKWYQANREKLLEQQKQYREANKEKILERQKKYYEDNKEKLLERHKKYNETNKEKLAEYHKQYRENNRDKLLEKRKQYYEANRERELERDKQYYEANKDKITERQKQYYEDNKDKITEYHKQYYEDNKDKIAEYGKQYREANKDKILERNKRYYHSPQGQAASFNRSQRRRAKQEKQGTGITKDQWLEMMSFFDWRCAYSGKRLTNKTRSIDHIVPLNSGGDHEIWNVVPMTRSLNSSKQDKDMLEWYKEQDFYDPKRLQKIYEWQEHAYNKWGKDTLYFNSGNIQIKLI